MTSEGGRELAGSERFALGGDDLRPLLALGLGLPGHRALHGVGQLDVPQLDDGGLGSPLLRLHVQDLADVLIDRVSIRQQLIQGVTPHDGAKRGLGDLADRRLDVPNRDHRPDGILHPVVRHRRPSMLTLSLVMISWDWIGIVTIRNDTR